MDDAAIYEESENDCENDSQETERSSHEKSTTFHSENPCEHCESSNVYGTLTMKCPKCFWHDYYKSRVQYAITRSPRREITSKRAFFGVTIVERLHTKTRRSWKPIDLFTDTAYGGHIELIRFKEYYRMPRGMSTFRLYFRALFGTFFLKVFLE